MSDLICIICPRGCSLKVDSEFNVVGNFCKRGIDYAKSEITNPVRVITSTVKINSSFISRLPVKTDKPIPKEKIYEFMKIINKIEVNPPVKVKDILVENVLGTNINIVSTRTINE